MRNAKKSSSKVNVVAEGFVEAHGGRCRVSWPGNYGGLAASKGRALPQVPRRRPPASDALRPGRSGRRRRSPPECAASTSWGARREGALTARTKWTIAAAKPDAKGDELDLSELRMKLDPRASGRQMFDEAWRIGRDWFYDDRDARRRLGRGCASATERWCPTWPTRSRPGFHLRRDGRRARGRALLRAERREPSSTASRAACSGAEFEADESGRYRIAKIFPGENWDDAYRSPLTEQGVDVAEGDFLLAIDGVELTTGPTIPTGCSRARAMSRSC